MNSRKPVGRSQPLLSRHTAPLVAGALIVVAVFAVYSGSFDGPFVFDDTPSILSNPTILHLGRLQQVFNPPSAGGVTVGGRPLLNLSLALNYAISGYRVWSYHLLNLIIHAFAGITLLGLARRTMNQMQATHDEITAERSLLFAFFCALVWTIHPLQTESVTYVIQRAESMMGLFYLLTLYAFIRGTESEAHGVRALRRQNPGTRWLTISWLACLAGMATKEVMVSAPVVVFLYDRCFVSKSIRQAWNQHRRYYLALASTWIPLACLVVQTGGNRGGSAGVGTPVPWGTYLLTQFPAIIHYLRLTIWPHPLVFYYPVRWPKLMEVAPSAIAVLLLAAGTAYALFRNLVTGFLGTWFFAVLAPTSLIPGTGQTLAEHRMYLALAPVAALATGLCMLGAVRLSRPRTLIALTSFACLAVVLGAGTILRNRTYRTELSLWSDTANAVPDNALAECNLGIAFADSGDLQEATAQFQRALKILPDFPNALINLGNILRSEKRLAEATAYYERALRIKADVPETWANLANILREQGRTAEAIESARQALKIRPLYPEGLESLAMCLEQEGDTTGAIATYLRALDLKPGFAEADYNLAVALFSIGRTDDSIERYRISLKLNPSSAEAHNGLGVALAKSGHVDEAAAEYRLALSSKPDYAEADYNLGNLMVQAGRTTDAAAPYRAALQARPDFPEAACSLANVLLTEGHVDEAITYYRESIRLQPESADTHYNLAVAFRAIGRLAEANEQYQTAARLEAKRKQSSP